MKTINELKAKFEQLRKEDIDDFCRAYSRHEFDKWVKDNYKKESWQADRVYSEEDLKQFAFECVANFLSNNDNEVEIKLVDVIIDRVNDKFKQFKNK